MPQSTSNSDRGTGDPAQTFAVIFLLYLLVPALSPLLLGSNRDWAWPLMSVLCMLAGLSLLVNMQVPRLVKEEKFMLGAFGLLAAWMLLQLEGVPGLSGGLTLDAFETRSELLRTVGLAAFFAASISLLCTRARVEAVLYTVVLVGVLEALIGSVQQLVFDLPRARGTFPNPNHYAGYLEVALAFAIGLLLARQADGKGGRSLVDFVTGPSGRLRLMIVIMVIGLIMSRSRMGNLGFLTAILVTAAVAYLYTRQVSRRTMVLLASIFLLDVLIVGQYFGIERLEERLRQSPGAVVGRVDLFAYNFRMIRDQPLTGFGAGTYEAAMRMYRDKHVTARPAHAENDYMEFLVELGVIGSIPLLIILVFGCRAQVRLLLHEDEAFIRGIAFGCLMGTVCLMLHGFADVNLQIPSNSLLMVLLMALPFALARVRRDDS